VWLQTPIQQKRLPHQYSLFLNRLELLAPPFPSREKDGKRKKHPLRNDCLDVIVVNKYQLLVKTPTTAER
jgi:hypothetical protein